MAYIKVYRWQDTKIDYVILNYEQVVNDWKFIQRICKYTGG
jgi:hypothetical protein